MIKSLLRKTLVPPPPYHLRKNFISFSEDKTEEIVKFFKEKYFLKNNDVHVQPISNKEIEAEVKEHVFDRVRKFRETIIPWIDSIIPLKGSKILEIGCGTGSSTFALAEQGAEVIGIDIIGEHLEVAKKRCELYGLKARFQKVNATEVNELFKNEHFDLIIFFAALEHMTVEERITAIQRTWNMLSNGKFWCITGSPNRLWFFDDHTSELPFFHWLPDNLAFLYSRFSPKKSISEVYREINDETMCHFLRRGRGISYHEFECSIGSVQQIKEVSSLSEFMRKNIFRKIKWNLSKESKYEKLLMKVGPSIHRGFYQPYLDLIIRK